jgi:hypothetical protein
VFAEVARIPDLSAQEVIPEACLIGGWWRKEFGRFHKCLSSGKVFQQLHQCGKVSRGWGGGGGKASKSEKRKGSGFIVFLIILWISLCCCSRRR